MNANLIREFSESSQLGSNGDYVEHLYEAWLGDPSSVSNDWQRYFDGLPRNGGGDTPHSLIIARIEAAQRNRDRHSGAAAPVSDEHARKQAGVLRLLTAYRSRGHLGANLDPLQLANKRSAPDLGLPFHNLSEADLDTEFDTGTYCGGDHPRMKLRDLWSNLKATYTQTVGAEFMHISDHEQRRWVYSRLEKAAGNAGLTHDEQLRVLERLTAADGLERYLHTKYVGQKRFSLEGGDALIPMIDTLIRSGGDDDVGEMVIGMAHRGRLNVLVNTLGKPPLELFDEFEGKFHHPDDPDHSGDVKYHNGFSADVTTPGGNNMHLAMAFNPSHLEVVDPVVAGSVRARQTRRHDKIRGEVMPIMIHGDAAFAGQGVVMETLQMSQARGFGVGGSVHIIINNQIGFTTSNPQDARSTLYCTDVAKLVNAPIFHVNGDDPEAVVQVTRLAFEFRRRFKKDVVIDLVCYRRNGHNEADEPAATQPTMYQVIRKHPVPRVVYAARLQKAGVIDADAAKGLVETYRKHLEEGHPVTDLATEQGGTTFQWSKHIGGSLDETVDTGLTPAAMKKLCGVILATPEGFKLHSRVKRIYDDRQKMIAGDKPLDWGFAENLAYAGLISEGCDMRLVGQDSGRGTFFHRHAVLHDQETGNTAIPLASIDAERDIEVIDSLLSEEAVMAFEYGYATADPETLVIWEGQFGDFANGAQVVIDQFISAGESKWNRLCGLVLFLPHGYEGQGPEHSSARLERYLQLCALNNMQVCVPTTPAQAFHMIRRQMLRKVRKPLIVMTPKSLLRHKRAVSTLEELSNGHFHNVIADQHVKTAKKVKRVVLCSGKVYYDLLEAVETDELDNVAIVRVEQLYPFPRGEVSAELDKYKSADEVVWCQEEPMNQGAWFQIRHHLQACVSDRHALSYAGRARSASPACGHLNTHIAEQKALVEQALTAPLDTDHTSE
ncbi:MAG TPA: 2-oxoglutarate dehydrogenase E1 component [Oleiagrimonas sp.]|nr:2-oxoglutarate dehydrogenase E1 component [Oleiagrimonas sp.]